MLLGLVLEGALVHRSVFVYYSVTHAAFDYSLHLGLTDEEVELAIQRSGSVEEAAALSPHIIHSRVLAPAAYSECYRASIIQTRGVYTLLNTCICYCLVL